MDLGKIFENNSDCYADTWLTDENGNMGEGLVIMAMTKEKFIEVVSELVGGNSATTSNEPVLTLPIVSNNEVAVCMCEDDWDADDIELTCKHCKKPIEFKQTDC